MQRDDIVLIFTARAMSALIAIGHKPELIEEDWVEDPKGEFGRFPGGCSLRLDKPESHRAQGKPTFSLVTTHEVRLLRDAKRYGLAALLAFTPMMDDSKGK